MLLAAPSALPKSLLQAEAKLTSSGTAGKLTVTNISTDGGNIKCIRWTAPEGASITGMQPPAGWNAVNNTRVIALRQDNPGLGPGQSVEVSFTTAAPLTGPSVYAYSPTCAPGSDLVGTVPPPTAPPCECSAVDAFLNNFHVFGVNTTRLEFDVAWQLTCTAGDGQCKGQVKVLAPRGADFLSQAGKTLRPAHPKIVTVACAGGCAKSTLGKETLQWVAFQTVKQKNGKTTIRPNPSFTPKGRAGKTFPIRISLTCIGSNGIPGPPTVKNLKLTFDKLGQVDYKKSDLNGDGAADNGQLKSP